MPATEIDLENIVAIDVHTHVQASVEAGRGFAEDSPEAAVAQVFGSDALLTVPELAAFYRERKMAAVCFMVDSVRWGGPVTNEEILELSRSERDVLLPFVSVDPHRGAAGV
jgi:predicted TIM-barrel fold metal-dependent hydrolase